VVPDHPKMRPMIAALTEYLTTTRRADLPRTGPGDDAPPNDA
jgi:hypothetical protein